MVTPHADRPPTPLLTLRYKIAFSIGIVFVGVAIAIWFRAFFVQDLIVLRPGNDYCCWIRTSYFDIEIGLASGDSDLHVFEWRTAPALHSSGFPYVSSPPTVFNAPGIVVRAGAPATRPYAAPWPVDTVFLSASSWNWFLIIPLLPNGFLLFVFLRRRRRWRILQRKAKCPSCGYDLRATPDRCPECGLEISAPAERA